MLMQIMFILTTFRTLKFRKYIEDMYFIIILYVSSTIVLKIEFHLTTLVNSLKIFIFLYSKRQIIIIIYNKGKNIISSKILERKYILIVDKMNNLNNLSISYFHHAIRENYSYLRYIS